MDVKKYINLSDCKIYNFSFILIFTLRRYGLLIEGKMNPYSYLYGVYIDIYSDFRLFFIKVYTVDIHPMSPVNRRLHP